MPRSVKARVKQRAVHRRRVNGRGSHLRARRARNEDEGLMERVCRRQRGAGAFKGLRDVHERSSGSSSTMRIERPSRVGRCIRFSSGAAKRKLPEAVRPRHLGRWCPELSINPHTATKRDDRLGRQSPRAGAGSVLRVPVNFLATERIHALPGAQGLRKVPTVQA